MRHLAILLIACGCGGKPHAASTPARVGPGSAASDADGNDQALIDRQDAAALRHNMPIIRTHVLAYSGAFRACYEKALRDSPGLSGEVNVHFTVTGDGTVANAVGTGMNPAIATCCASVMYGVHFPPTVTGGSIDVNYPFEFHTEAAAGSGAGSAAPGAPAAPGATRAGTVGSSPVIVLGSTGSDPVDADRVMIRSQIRAHIGPITYCYEKQLVTKPDLAGKVMVHFAIARDGHVSSSVGSGLDPAVASCVASAIERIAFPAPGHVINVNYPFEFRGASPAAASGR